MNTSKINFRKLRNKTTEKQFNFNNVQKHNIKLWTSETINNNNNNYSNDLQLRRCAGDRNPPPASQGLG